MVTVCSAEHRAIDVCRVGSDSGLFQSVSTGVCVFSHSSVGMYFVSH